MRLFLEKQWSHFLKINFLKCGIPLYIKKCNEYLTSGPYTKLKKDPTSSIVSKVTKKLIELRNNNFIEQQEYFKLKPTGTQPPRFYGLPKTHKDGDSHES